jgi:hypothetical protein
LDIGPSFARTRINQCVNVTPPSGKGSTHTNLLIGVTPPPEVKTPTVELLLEVVGPIALLGVEVLGYSKTLEETPGVFLPEDSVVAGGIFIANWL